MRLAESELVAIKATALRLFGPDSVVRLFGSRLDDRRRGGDIDLHIELPDAAPDWPLRSHFLTALYDAIGEREIDVLYSVRGQTTGKVEMKALVEGVIL